MSHLYIKNLDFVNWLLIPIFLVGTRLWLDTDSLRMFARPCLPFPKIRSQERCVFIMIFYKFISSHDTIDQRNNACFARLARPRRASIVDPAHSGCYQGMSLIH